MRKFFAAAICIVTFLFAGVASAASYSGSWGDANWWWPGICFCVTAEPTHTVDVYLNNMNTDVRVGPATSNGGSFNNTADGYTSLHEALVKVVDAPSPDASQDHTQSSHIWWTAPDDNGVLELILSFDRTYSLKKLHFWNYAFDSFSADHVKLNFFRWPGSLVGNLEFDLLPSGSEDAILAQEFAFPSTYHDVKLVSVLLSGTNGEVDFQNIAFSGTLTKPIPLPASGAMLLGSFGLLSALRRRKMR